MKGVKQVVEHTYKLEERVTGDIAITISADQPAPSYTNLADPSSADVVITVNEPII